MRKFTKQHNELQWLFPICESEETASRYFDEIEGEANDLLEMCYGDQQTFTRDDMIDAFMKGNSRATRSVGFHVWQLKQQIKNLNNLLCRIDKNYEKRYKALMGETDE